LLVARGGGRDGNFLDLSLWIVGGMGVLSQVVWCCERCGLMADAL
jgi:hypothetical protein